MKPLLPILALLWLCPWGLIAGGLILTGKLASGTILGVGSLVGVIFVLALARAAKGN